MRGRDPNNNEDDNREDTRGNSQTRRRTPSVPAQFRFIPPRYAPRTTAQTMEQSESTTAATTETTEHVPDDQEQTAMDIPARMDENLAQMYKNMFNNLTVDQQAALLRGRVHLPPDPSHNLRASAAGPGRGYSEGQGYIETRAVARIIPMRPLDVGKDWALDYTSPQTIKLYHKAISAVAGEAFDGKYLYSFLARLQDKARTYSWNNILTIEGKLLTKHYAELSLATVRAHAQKYQDEARRSAQNAEQLLLCLQASITRTVYNKIYQFETKYTITREPEKENVWDGVCYLKVLIDSYHVNTRSSTAQIRKKLAQLSGYMRNVAKGDVQQLCTYTRALLDQLNAAGETTMDLLSNLMEALKLAPNADYQRWLKTRIDMWSTKQIDWKHDGSDLMEEAEQYYLELKTTKSWDTRGKQQHIYALSTLQTESDEGENDKENDEDIEDTMQNKTVLALAAQLHKLTKQGKYNNKNPKYKWKLKAPKDGEPNTRRVLQDGQKRTYHWCPFHNMWTIHKPNECKRYPVGKSKPPTKDKEKQKAYMEAKTALLHADLGTDSDNDSNTDEEDNKSNTSVNTENMDDDDSNTS